MGWFVSCIIWITVEGCINRLSSTRSTLLPELFLSSRLLYISASTKKRKTKKRKMLINNQKYSCEACIRGHRVTTCKHHGMPIIPSTPPNTSFHYSTLQNAIQIRGLISEADRPLTKINRKGRPFSTCSICHRTPCAVPDEHARLRREREGESRHHYKVFHLLEK